MSEGVWQAVVAFGVALAVAVGALMLVGWAATAVLGPAAIGWLAIFAGQHPAEYGPGQHNRARALADLLLFAGCGPLGVLLFRHGAREGELNWTIEGLFLTACAVVLGLGSAIPRLYFARRTRRSSPEAVEAEGVIAFAITATLGIGLSLGISMGFAESRGDIRERALRPETWRSGCVRFERLKSCGTLVSLWLVAAEEGLHRIEVKSSCDPRLVFKPADGHAVAPLPWIQLHRLGVKAWDREQEIRTHLVRLVAGQKVLLELSKDRGEGCFFKLRYRFAKELAR